MQDKNVRDLVIILPILMSIGTLFLAFWLLKGPTFLPMAKSIFRALAFSTLIMILWIKYREKHHISASYLTFSVIIFIFSMTL